MFWASLCPSSGAYQLQQQPLVYRRNVVVAVLLAVVGPDGKPEAATALVVAPDDGHKDAQNMFSDI